MKILLFISSILLGEISEIEKLIVKDEISMEKEHGRRLSDIIYTFKNLRGGKGFDLTKNKNTMIKNLSELQEIYPFLFRINGNDLVYPSEIGLKLGDLILSYNKLNKQVSEVKIEKYNFKFNWRRG